MLVEVFGIFERVTADTTLVVSYCHMLAETSRRIKAELTRDAFEMLGCRHGSRQRANANRCFPDYKFFRELPNRFYGDSYQTQTTQ